jgi:hypothetical protein
MSAQNKTPEWLLERLALGELDAAAAADVRRRLAAEGRDPDAELAALAVSNRSILAEHPPARVAAAVRARAAARRPARGWLPLASLALAGVAAVVLVARPATHEATTGGHEVGLEDTTPKGRGPLTALHVYRHGNDGDAKLADGARAATGDLLQLTYQAGERDNFGALLSIDGRGQVTVHLPEAGAETSPRLSAKGEVKLPSAYELDDAPAFERFFFVASETPFPMSTVLDAARALAARPAAARTGLLPLPASLKQDALTLEKSRKETP